MPFSQYKVTYSLFIVHKQVETLTGNIIEFSLTKISVATFIVFDASEVISAYASKVLLYIEKISGIYTLYGGTTSLGYCCYS